MTSIQEKTGDDPLKVFKKAVDNVKPALEVKSRRVGGSNYQVPIEVNPNRRLSLSIRWLVSYARSRGDGKTIEPLQPDGGLLGADRLFRLVAEAIAAGLGAEFEGGEAGGVVHPHRAVGQAHAIAPAVAEVRGLLDGAFEREQALQRGFGREPLRAGRRQCGCEQDYCGVTDGRDHFNISLSSGCMASAHNW